MIEIFLNELGRENFLLDENDLEAYRVDRYKLVKGEPLAVFLPKKAADIGKLLILANKYKMPIYPFGAGTSTTGAATPINQGLVISFQKMNHILELDLENQIAVVEPGVITKVLQDAVEEKGLFYPPDPASLAECTLGGNVAQNAGGARALKYGVTRNYVLGIEGFWGSGQGFRFGGKQIKQALGYDLKQLLIGSEGTLGIITKIYLKLLRQPKYFSDLLIGFTSFSEAFTFFDLLRKQNVDIATTEFMDKFCLQAAEKYLNQPFPFSKANFSLLIKLDGNYESALQQDLSKIKAIFASLKVTQYQFVNNQEDAQQIWQFRRVLSDALRQISKTKMSCDIVVPLNQINSFMNFLVELNKQTSLEIFGFGHLGDGNIHVNVLQLADNKEEKLDFDYFIRLIMAKAVQLGGNISGEHGIGLAKKKYLSLIYSPGDLRIFQEIKRLFDPQNILNPTKIIDIGGYPI